MTHPKSGEPGDALHTETKYQSFLNRITDGFTAIDKNWNYIFVNKQAASLAHREPQDLVGKNIWQEFPEGINSPTYLAYHEAMREQQYVNVVDYYAPLDLWFENHIYPSPEGLTVFVKNITDRKKLEAELADRIHHESSLITATTLDAQEKERNAIGIELHDNVNQILVAAKLLMKEMLSKPRRTKELLPLCINNIDKAINENKKLAHELISPDPLVEDLVDQIKRLNLSMLNPAGIKTTLLTGAFTECLLHADQKLAIYRIVQEHYSNIIAHANSNNVISSLSTEREIFLLHIRDDGIGVDKEQIGYGNGLRNIARRVNVLKGSIEIDSVQGGGFSIQVHLPLFPDNMK